MSNQSQSEPALASSAQSALAIHLQIDEPAKSKERAVSETNDWNDPSGTSDTAGDFTIAYATSAFSSPSTIAGQMRELGERLPGAMSWLSLFEQD